MNVVPADAADADAVAAAAPADPVRARVEGLVRGRQLDLRVRRQRDPRVRGARRQPHEQGLRTGTRSSAGTTGYTPVPVGVTNTVVGSGVVL